MLTRLRIDGIIGSEEARFEPLTGGVSSDIFLVHDGDRKIVVKQALEKLKVEADWFADVSRNATERDYISYVSEIRPSSVPQIIASGDGYFAMEYLGKEFRNWKQAMLDGQFEVDWARQAGAFLGEVHHRSKGNQEVAARFAKMESFWQLRIDAYLVATGAKHPELEALFLKEAYRLKSETSVLVHGDFSPKNILVSKDRLVVLDCEVACYADPAFDVAFLFTHLFLKALYHQNYYTEVREMIGECCQAYGLMDKDLERRVSRLLLMLLLARVDGKSPVEYLVDEGSKNFVRTFTGRELVNESSVLEEILEKWIAGIRSGGA